jgi:hypothetical protein
MVQTETARFARSGPFRFHGFGEPYWAGWAAVRRG